MNAQELWGQLEANRTAVLARAALLLTDNPRSPSPEGYTEAQPLPTPYQSLGARGTNNIASKLLLTLFPPGQTPMRMQLQPKIQKALQANNQLTETQKRLAEYEQLVADRIETLPYRPSLFEVLKHLIVTGNMLVRDDKKVLRLYRLDQYVIRRAPDGSPRDAVVKEKVYPDALPALVRIAAKILPDAREPVDLYTVIEWREDRVREWQEVNGLVVAGSDGDWPVDKCPWMALRWTAVPCANYGRGLCEEYLGDLLSLEGLMKSIVKFSAAASKIVFLTKPGAAALWTAINRADLGDAVSGNRGDVETLQVEKFNDFQVAKATSDGLEQRLSQAFLLRSGTIRDAERVTAEEIRQTAQELEDVYGGTYTVLAQELQLPLVKCTIHDMTQAGELPELPPNAATPIIVTGFQALGRNHTVNNLFAFKQAMEDNPQQMATVNWSEYNRRIGVGLGVEDLDNLLLTDQQMQDAQRQQLTSSLLQSSAGPLAANAAKAASA